MTATNGSHARELVFDTRPRAFLDITREVQAFVAETGVKTGLLTLFIRHTSASLVIQENADPDVLKDLVDALDGLAPEGAGWRHDAEGPDDMPAHVKAALTATSLTIPVMNGRAALGTWQAIYVAEHRAQPHRRRVVAHLLG
jgi:secondary thiamine-phosphate synthase enzyme